MTEGELRWNIELSHGLVLARKVEERVVAEALIATWSKKDLALDGAVACGENFAIARSGEDAAIAGGWFGIGNFAEGFKQAEVISFVSCGVGWAGEVHIFGVAGGTDAGC